MNSIQILLIRAAYLAVRGIQKRHNRIFDAARVRLSNLELSLMDVELIGADQCAPAHERYIIAPRTISAYR